MNRREREATSFLTTARRYRLMRADQIVDAAMRYIRESAAADGQEPLEWLRDIRLQSGTAQIIFIGFLEAMREAMSR